MITIITSRFNPEITNELHDCALATLKEAGIDEVRSLFVPGAFEIPLMAKRVLDEGNCEAIICLGAVIRGETIHFELICNEVARAVMDLQLTYSTPLIFGIIAAENEHQAKERSSPKGYNRGREAALAALEMI